MTIESEVIWVKLESVAKESKSDSRRMKDFGSEAIFGEVRVDRNVQLVKESAPGEKQELK